MIRGWVTTDNYDFLYLVAVCVLWFVWRTARARYRSGVPWERREITGYGFLAGGAVILVVAASLDSMSALRLPIFLIGVGCMLFSLLSLRRAFD